MMNSRQMEFWRGMSWKEWRTLLLWRITRSTRKASVCSSSRRTERTGPDMSYGESRRAIQVNGLGHSMQARSGLMGKQFSEEAEVRKRTRTKLVREGRYVAEVEVELREREGEWSPSLSLEDA